MDQSYPRASDNTDPEEKILEDRVKRLNSHYPLLDGLMCQVLLKCPSNLLEELISKPDMWKHDCNKSTVLHNNITISDPEPVLKEIADEITIID
jgi:hypothetical protein